MGFFFGKSTGHDKCKARGGTQFLDAGMRVLQTVPLVLHLPVDSAARGKGKEDCRLFPAGFARPEEKAYLWERETGLRQNVQRMKFISWNVNGLRACCGKGFKDTFAALDADFFCLQETKLQEGQIDLTFEGYRSYWNYAEKKGYSGTAVFSRHVPLAVTRGLGLEEHDKEGRVITLEMPEFFLVTVYVPNSQDELKRLDYRMQWEEAFRAYLLRLDARKPVVVCGDLNVAHREIDLKNPQANRRNAGFTDEEREKFGLLLESGFTDTFRFFYPDRKGIYSWWSYRFKAREKNAGWRIDYFLVSKRLETRLESATIHTEIFGSDHCPVEVDLF